MKRLQVDLSEEAQRIVDQKFKEANANFKSGTIRLGDLVSEMIITSKVDIRSLQLKRTNLRRSLHAMADQPNLDLDTAIKTLIDLRQKTYKKPARLPNESES